MIIDLFHYSYINAKTRSLKGQLLGCSDYDCLCKARGYTALTECLRSKVYCENLQVQISSYDELIELYYKGLFTDYVKLIDSLWGNKRGLICHIYRRYELENLKVILRNICYQKPKEGLKGLLFPLIKYQSIPINELWESIDLVELIKRLKGTWYHDPLENSLYRFEDEGETFPLEMALDLGYYKLLWEILSSLSRKEQKIAKSLLGIQLDILNIMWIIRFKERYRFSPEEILNYSLVYGRYISQKIRKKMAYSIDQKDIAIHLKGTPYKDFLKDVNDPEIANIRLLEYLLHIAKKSWCRFPFQISTILDYILFKEIEVKNLITITEANRMGMATEDIHKYIVHFN